MSLRPSLYCSRFDEFYCLSIGGLGVKVNFCLVYTIFFNFFTAILTPKVFIGHPTTHYGNTTNLYANILMLIRHKQPNSLPQLKTLNHPFHAFTTQILGPL